MEVGERLASRFHSIRWSTAFVGRQHSLVDSIRCSTAFVGRQHSLWNRPRCRQKKLFRLLCLRCIKKVSLLHEWRLASALPRGSTASAVPQHSIVPQHSLVDSIRWSTAFVGRQHSLFHSIRWSTAFVVEQTSLSTKKTIPPLMLALY